MAESAVKIHIPEGLITDTIRAEIVRQIGTGPELVEAIIRRSMSAKNSRSYGSKSIFEESVEGMIIDEAKKVFAEWMETNREGIKKALFKYLNSNKQKKLTEFAEKMAECVTKYNMRISLDLSQKDT